jgi:hypothetical protein
MFVIKDRQWLMPASEMMSRRCPLRVHDDLGRLFTGSHASDNENLLMTQASTGGNKWPIRWSN